MQSVRTTSLFLLTGCLFVLVACEDYDDEIEKGYGDGDVYSRAAVVGTYQAEDHTFQNGCREQSNHGGYTGSGFMDYGGNGSMVEWNNIKAPSAGKYELTFRYANGGAGDRQCSVTVNDTNVVGNLAFGKTGSWTTWKTATIKAILRAGNNKIRATANTGAGGPNLDKLDLMSEEGGGGGDGGRCVEASENKSATLSCPSGQVITRIDFASYGLPSGSCSAGFSKGTCHASTSTSKVQSLCLNKQSCTVGANNGNFGDPCAGVYKKLAITYTCGGDGGGGDDGGGDDNGDSCVEAAENKSATLSCLSGQVITKIDFASYGSPTGSCSAGFSKGTCHASASTSKVQSLCLNKRSCAVGANNGTFGDPCAGVSKKLAITYNCSGGGGDDGGGGGETSEIFGNHVGGYNGPVTSGGFVPSEYNAGYSMYVAAWSLFEKYPGRNSQTGLYGTWMHTKEVENPPIEKMYSDIEGGLGWWRDTRFATETPKFIMGGVALNFSSIANGPGAGAGDWVNPRGKYGVAQLSPWLLWPPDGLNMKQGASGELLGYGYLPLPLTNPKKVTAGKNVVTGNQCWTLFFNTKNFKGPATFFLPYFFSKPSVSNPALSGMFLDSRPAGAGGQISMETQHTPAAQATTPDGRTYVRIAPLLFPREDDGTSILVHNLFYYDKTALWDAVVRWFSGGTAANGYINSDNYYHREFSWHSAGWSIWEDPYSGGNHKEIVWDNYRTAITEDPHTAVVKWNRDLVKEVEVRGSSFNLLPEYLVLDKSTNKWKAVRAEEVPDVTGLKNYRFPYPGGAQEPYVTPNDPNSAWKKPGPVAGPFYAYPGDGSKITYYWYRFADQPAMLNADMTDAEREMVQKRVEKLHRNWTKERNYLAPPAIDKPLVSIDPALIVQPPAGLEVGYVPIATRQELAK